MTDNAQYPANPDQSPTSGDENQEAALTTTTRARRAGFLSREAWKNRPVLAGSLGALGLVLALGALSGLADDDEDKQASESLVIAVVPESFGLDQESLEELLGGIDVDRDELSEGTDGGDTRWSDDGQGPREADQAGQSPAPDEPSTDVSSPSEGNATS